MSDATNRQIYSKTGELIKGDISISQKVYFTFRTIAFEKLDVVSKSFQFFIFRRFDENEDIENVIDHLYTTVTRFWMPSLIVGSLIYLLICGYIVNYIAASMTQPFLELSRRIRLNV